MKKLVPSVPETVLAVTLTGVAPVEITLPLLVIWIVMVPLALPPAVSGAGKTAETLAARLTNGAAMLTTLLLAALAVVTPVALDWART